MKTETLKSVQRVVPIDSLDIKPHPKNPRRGNIAAIKDSIKTNGYYPTVFIQESTGYILKGNHTWKAVKELYQAGFKQYKEVTINVLDVNDHEALRIVLADNASSDFGTYGNEDVYDILKELETTELGLSGTLWTNQELEDLTFALNKKPTIAAEDVDSPDDDEMKERDKKKDDVKAKTESALQHNDTLVAFAAEAEYDIPILDIDMQVEKVSLPFMVYSMQRTSKALPRGEVGTLGFYAEDVTFEKFWRNPNAVVEYPVKNVVEVNFSTDSQAPRAFNIWQIYRKRWLGRYWQSKGLRLMVDVCVNRSAWDVVLHGVPKGWKAYCNRGNVFTDEATSIAHYVDMFDLCAERAGTDKILYMIYGGGNVLKRLCADREWIWIPDEKTVMHGKERDSLAALEKSSIDA